MLQVWKPPEVAGSLYFKSVKFVRVNVIFGRENRKIVREEGFWRDLAQFGRKNEKIVREGGFCLGASLPGSRVFSKAAFGIV